VRKLLRLFALACVLALAGNLPAGAEPNDRSPNVNVVGAHSYTGGTEVTFEGDYVYAGQMNGRTNRGDTPGQGGFFVFDVAGGGFELAGQLLCPGNDNDVTVVRPGLVAVAHHTSSCNPRFNARGNGIMLVDVSDPAAPVPVGGVAVPSAHTLTVHPSGDYVYVNPGGLANANGIEAIVDIRNPASPVVAAQFVPNRIGCHDLQFHVDPAKPFAYCAGAGEIQVWDVSDPLKPVTVGRHVNPAIQFPHNAVVSPDGTKLVIDDEAFGVHECVSEQSLYGSLWIYDISVPDVPLLAGRIAPPASRSVVGHYEGWSDSWCSAHNYNFIPGTNIVVSSWFTGGTRVHDISDPLRPVELAWYKPADTVAYTAHWHAGRIYVNDSNRGMEVLEVDGLAEGDLTPAALGASVPARPRVDMTPLLVPDPLPPRVTAPTERTLENTAFCVIPRPVR
jgi:hypothetical protein